MLLLILVCGIISLIVLSLMFWIFHPSTFFDVIKSKHDGEERIHDTETNFIAFYITGLIIVMSLFGAINYSIVSVHYGLTVLLDIFPVSVVRWIYNQFQNANIFIYSTVVYGALFAVFYIRNEMIAVTETILNYGIGRGEVEKLIELRSGTQINAKTKKYLIKIASSYDTKKLYYAFCIVVPIAILFHVLTQNIPLLIILYSVSALAIFLFLKNIYQIFPSKNLNKYLDGLDGEYSRILLLDNELEGAAAFEKRTLSEHQDYLNQQKHNRDFENEVTKYLDEIKNQEGAKSDYFNHEHLKNEFRNGYLSIARSLRQIEYKDIGNIVEEDVSFNKKQEMREIVKIARELRKAEGIVNKSVLLNKIDNVKNKLKIVGMKYVSRKSS